MKPNYQAPTNRNASARYAVRAVTNIVYIAAPCGPLQFNELPLVHHSATITQAQPSEAT